MIPGGCINLLARGCGGVLALPRFWMEGRDVLDSFLDECLGLFNDTLNACLAVPVLRFFAVFGLFLAVVNLVAYVVRSGRKGRL